MMIEVDTRTIPGLGISCTFYDDGDGYLVSVEGYTPLRFDTEPEAWAAWMHPFVYLPPEGAVSPSDGTEGVSPTQEPQTPSTAPTALVPGEDLPHQTADALIALRNVLASMNRTDFNWTVASVLAMIESLQVWREQGDETGPPPEPPKPYDHEQDNGPDIPF